VTSWPAPAKLNLFLHVVGRRPDGRHELQTLFQLLDYCDTLELTVTNDGTICRRGAEALPEDDLTVQAARCLQQASGTRLGAEIFLDKRIPVGAGLGGGSSDAATTLIALNQLWDTGLSRTRLAALGLTLGADVPVFVHGRSAWGEGVGEQLTPVDLPPRCYCVIWPQVAVSTAAIFGAAELTRTTPRIRIPTLLTGDLRNDLEPVASQKYPEVAKCLAWLDRFGKARMTGSGSAAFLTVADMGAGQAILDQLPPWYIGFVARGIARHPLYVEEPDGV
tara:strand:- start:1463 stop:2296 length:834 start_codon:yes stop_codon:yes gene_type:complete